MKIKKYIQFLKESSDYSLGCVMIEVDVKNWKEICSYIQPEDVYYDPQDPTYGIQENPHVTLFYGFHKEVTTEQVSDIIDDVMYEWRNQGLEDFDYNDVSDRIAIEHASDKPIEIEIDGIDIFENEKFDVVKFNVVKTDILQKLFDALSKLPNSNEYPDYKPHMTIAYVKSGTGKKYVKPVYKHKFESNTLCYSKPNGEKVYIEI